VNLPRTVTASTQGAADRCRWLCVVIAALAIAACAPPEEILPGERYDLRETDRAQSEFLEAVEAGTLDLTDPGQPPRRVPLAGYAVRGEPEAIRLSAPRRNAEWTHVNGSSAHIITHPALGPSLTRVWSVDIGQSGTRRVRMTADPVVGGGRVFTMSAFSEVQATGLGGAVAWRRDLTSATENPGEASGGGLAFADGRLYATTGYGALHALDAATGASLWTQQLGAVPNSAPTVVGDFVYLTSRDSRAWAVDRSTGRVVWSLEAGEGGPVVTDGAAPAVGAREVVFPFGSGDLIAALRRSGLRLWSGTVAGERLGRAYAAVGDISSDPVISGGRVYVGTPSGRLAAIDLATGERLWSADAGALSAVWPEGGSLFLVSDVGELVRLDAGTGAEIWAATLPFYTRERVRRRQGVFAHYGPVLAGGRLIVASSDGQIREVAPDSGQLLRQSPLDGPAAANPVVANETLFVVTQGGRLHAFR